MTITLTQDQEKAIQEAISSGFARSVDEFIDSAIGALPHYAESTFDLEKARQAGNRIRELRRGVTLDRQSLSIRELAHTGHKY
jgi:Arc/MetJ-type ribon-helix-helix transcriptional regulator